MAMVTTSAQVTVGKPWHIEVGASTCRTYKEAYSYNIRYISSHFKWSEDEGTEEEEKHPEKFKNSRFMFELFYTPVIEVLALGINYQSRFIHYKRFALDLYGGMRIFPISGPDFSQIKPLRTGTEIWYFNFGVLCQFDLGVISPFIDKGGDGILTIGAEFNLRPIYRKLKKRYRLRTKPYNKE